MNVKEFVSYLYDNAVDVNTLHTVMTAMEDIEELRRESFEVPEDITPEEYADAWNELVLASCENVRVPNASGNLVMVPRHTQMTNKQIAKVIQKAPDWDSVSDLVDYVLSEILEADVTDGGFYADSWEEKVENWCDEILALKEEE